jgi:hypothetical protein
MKEFKAETVDADGKPNFMNADEKIVYKLGSLSGFNLYWNCEKSIDCLISMRNEFKTNNDYCWNLMKESLLSGTLLNKPFSTFMQTNLDLNTRLVLRRSFQRDELNLPKITFESSVNAIEFVFRRIQYKSILEIFDHYSMLNIHKKYVKYRPLEIGSDRKKRARLWWKYGFSSIAETTWRSYKYDRIHTHFQKYKAYLRLYEQKMLLQSKSKDLNAKEQQELLDLERVLVLESIIDARNLVNDKLNPSANKTSDTSSSSQIKENLLIDRPLNYVEFRLVLFFPLISLKLKNTDHEILQLNFRNIATRVDTKPVANSVYFVLNTSGIDILGVYYEENLLKGENELVPIVTSKNQQLEQAATFSKTKIAEEDAKDMLFTFCFETNPMKIENAEFSIRAKFSSIEIYYEKTAITELLRFFKTDLIDFGEVKKIKDVWSKAGVIYAVESHKQFHVSAELSSPYFIIPMKGTTKLTKRRNDQKSSSSIGHSIVFFLGKTFIQSQIQPKLANYAPNDVQDLEMHFYDKLNLFVTDVQIILVPDRVDWRAYLDQSEAHEYKYHILYPVSTNNTLFLSINPSYKKLPKMKLDAVCSSIMLNFSDKKIIKLYEFSQKFPLPEVPKTTLMANNNNINSPMTSVSPKPSSTSVLSNNTTNRRSNLKDDSSSKSTIYHSLTGGIEFELEPDDEWDGPFNLPKYINGDPIPNYSQIIMRFSVKKFGINLNSTINDETEVDYLKLNLNEIRIDFAITKYGFNFRAGLGNLKLIDKIHGIDDLNPETEILSSSSTEEIIKFYFRQVDQEAPNFATLYSKIISNILFNFNCIHVACHRSVIVYFLDYAKRIIDNVPSMTKNETNRNSAAIDLPQQKPATEPKNTATTTTSHPSQPQITDKNKSDNDDDDVCNLNITARMNKLTWDMFDTNLRFGNMSIEHLNLTYNLRGIRTELNIQLRKILINYSDVDSSINDAYEQIIQCVADGDAKEFFDFKLVLFDTSKTTTLHDIDDIDESVLLRDMIYLNVGKIKVICLVKFVNELIEFVQPIVNPLPDNLTVQVRDQAYEAVKNAYQETENAGKKIYINIHVTSPQIIVPQNSSSLSGFLVDLGNLNISNSFREIPFGNTANSFTIMEYVVLSLENLEVKRIVYDEKNGVNVYRIKEQVIYPVSLNANVVFPLKNLEEFKYADMEIQAKISNLDCTVSVKSIKLLFLILNENLNEGIRQKDEEAAAAAAVVLKEIKHNQPAAAAAAAAAKNSSIDTDQIQILENKKEKKALRNRSDFKMDLELNKIRVTIVEMRRRSSPNVPPQSNANLSKDETFAPFGNNNLNNSNKKSSLNDVRPSNSTDDKSTKGTTTLSKYEKFSLLEIQDILFNFDSNENKSWQAVFKMRALHVNDLRPDSNLAVKE